MVARDGFARPQTLNPKPPLEFRSFGRVQRVCLATGDMEGWWRLGVSFLEAVGIRAIQIYKACCQVPDPWQRQGLGFIVYFLEGAKP